MTYVNDCYTYEVVYEIVYEIVYVVVTYMLIHIRINYVDSFYINLVP